MTTPTSIPAPLSGRTSQHRYTLLCVCLGNICRSPLARVVLQTGVELRGWGSLVHVDSCGTGAWHVGRPADPRTVQIASRYSLDMTHTARQVDAACDFAAFDLLLAMDRDNRDNLLSLGAPEERVRLMRSFDPALAGEREHKLDVPDPYYGSDDGFEQMYQMLTAAAVGLLDRLGPVLRAE